MLVLFVNLVFPILVCQVAEPQVSRLCTEAEEFIVMGKWLELASLMITSAELIFSKVSEKGRMLCFTSTLGVVFLLHFGLVPISFMKNLNSMWLVCFVLSSEQESFPNSATLVGYGIVDVRYSPSPFS